MKLLKGKAFFFKSIVIHLFLMAVIAIISISFWEDSFYNILTKNLSKDISKNSSISLIMIDDKSTDTYRWPWARELYGEIIDYLNKYTNAKVIVFDSVITSLDKYNPPESDNYFFKTVKNTPKYIGGFMAQLPKYENKLQGDLYDDFFENKFKLNIENLRSDAKLEKDSVYRSLMQMPKDYFNALKYTGAVNLNTNYNGYLYDSPDLIYYDNNYYPSLALRTYLFINNTDKLTLNDKFITVDKTRLKIPVKTIMKIYLIK